MLLKITLLTGEKLEFNIDKKIFIIGRSKDCDIVLPHEGMSRKHCLIEIKEGEFFVTDLDSKNGVFINDQKVEPGVPTQFLVSLNLSFGPVSSMELDELEGGPGAMETGPVSREPSLSQNTTRTVQKQMTSPRTRPLPPSEDKKSLASSRVLLLLLAIVVVGAFVIIKDKEKQNAPLTHEEMYE